jgi:hypothetical protein
VTSFQLLSLLLTLSPLVVGILILEGNILRVVLDRLIAGRGAHLLLVDDPHSEQDVINGNFAVFEKAYEWFTFGARTRLMPGGRVAIVQTRWHMDDLTGRVTKDMVQNPGSDQYEIIEFPAILDGGKSRPRTQGRLSIYRSRYGQSSLI